jgi:hypothetical protein
MADQAVTKVLDDLVERMICIGLTKVIAQNQTVNNTPCKPPLGKVSPKLTTKKIKHRLSSSKTYGRSSAKVQVP